MTQPTSPGSIPAGWYPTAAGSNELRWWDGTQWTEHQHLLDGNAGQQSLAPEGTSPNTVWIWIYAILPLAQLAELPLFIALFSRMFGAGFRNSSALLAAEYGPGSPYIAIQGVNVLIYAVWVIAGLLDYRALKARGVPRPFHWAWSFLSSGVYVIGRAVVVRRRTGSGMLPMVVYLVCLVADIVGVLVVTFTAIASVTR